MLASPVLDRLDGVRHAFFTRRGGVSTGVHASLNCGLGSSDERANVVENRRRAAERLGIGASALVTLRQVHGVRVVRVAEPLPAEAVRPRADAMVTDRPGVLLGILAADCAPVLLADAEGGVAGAAHAGWRGALAGVAARTVQAMAALGARPEAISAAVGPCIGRDSYQVGDELRERFVAADAGAAAFFRPDGAAGKHLFDLRGLVAAQLEEAGVGAVDALPRDTYAEDGLFFSYRRACRLGEGDCGRGLSAIALSG